MKVLIYDIETMQELFLIDIYNPSTDTHTEIIVSKWHNNIDHLSTIIERHQDYYWVGYNNLRFDSQVVEWILRNCDNWHEKSNLEICALIAHKAQDVMYDAN